MTPSDVAEQLQTVGWLSSVASITAKDPGPFALLPEDRLKAMEPKLSQVHMGSPLIFTVLPSASILEASAALSFMVFGLKQIWGLDLELQTRRERLRQQLAAATQRAEQAEASLEADRRARETQFEKELALLAREQPEQLTDSRDGRSHARADQAVHRGIEKDLLWGRGVSLGVELRRSNRWYGRQAKWRLDDDDSL